MKLGRGYVAAYIRDVDERWPEATSLMEVDGGKSVGWIDTPKGLMCNGDDNQRYSRRLIE